MSYSQFMDAKTLLHTVKMGQEETNIFTVKEIILIHTAINSLKTTLLLNESKYIDLSSDYDKWTDIMMRYLGNHMYVFTKSNNRTLYMSIDYNYLHKI